MIDTCLAFVCPGLRGARARGPSPKRRMNLFFIKKIQHRQTFPQEKSLFRNRSKDSVGAASAPDTPGLGPRLGRFPGRFRRLAGRDDLPALPALFPASSFRGSSPAIFFVPVTVDGLRHVHYVGSCWRGVRPACRSSRSGASARPRRLGPSVRRLFSTRLAPP